MIHPDYKSQMETKYPKVREAANAYRAALKDHYAAPGAHTLGKLKEAERLLNEAIEAIVSGGLSRT